MCNSNQKKISLLHKSLISASFASVFKEMACYGNYEDGTGMRPSNATLAKACKLSEKTIKRAKKFLRETGLIIRTAKHSMQAGTCDVYKINHPVLDHMVAESKELFLRDKQIAINRKLNKKLNKNICVKPVDNLESRDKVTLESRDKVTPYRILDINTNTVGTPDSVDNPEAEMTLEHEAEEAFAEAATFLRECKEKGMFISPAIWNRYYSPPSERTFPSTKLVNTGLAGISSSQGNDGDCLGIEFLPPVPDNHSPPLIS